MLTVHKLSGAGNSFLIIDVRGSKKSMKVVTSKRRQLARELCDPNHSIGADGLLFLESVQGAMAASIDLRWDFYNADGSSAEMCGNAARTVGLYIQKTSRNKPIVTTVETRAGVISIFPVSKIRNGGIFRVEMPAIREIELDCLLSNREKSITQIEFDFVNSGVPHAVIRLKTISPEENVGKLVETVDKIRALTRFKKNGVNVTFYSETKAKKIQSLTFERGVTGYTQACGTGAVAAAVSYGAHHGLTKGRISVKVPGGQLSVELGQKHPILIGPAIYAGQISIE